MVSFEDGEKKTCGLGVFKTLDRSDEAMHIMINIIYLDGGALLARDYTGKYRSHMAYDCDLCAKAKGYEFLARQLEGK